jgi:DNA-binding transcriptional MerR regulator
LSIDTLRYYERINLAHPPRAGRGRPASLRKLICRGPILAKLRTTGMPFKDDAGVASLRRHGTGAARRKGILEDRRRVVAERNVELWSCLDILGQDRQL